MSKKLFNPKIMFLIILLNIFSVYSEEAIKIQLEGNWSYAFSDSNHSCKLTGDKIVNRGDNNSTFKLAFFLCPEKYSGGSIVGYNVGSKLYDILESGYQYNNISVSFDDFKKQQPPNGDYYPVILILVYKNGDYGIVDYLNFPEPCHFHNYIVDEVNRLLSDLENAKKQQRTYTYSSNPYDALDWVLEVHDLESKLISLGYDVYGSKNISKMYLEKEKRLELSAIPDASENKTSNYSYSSTDYYFPDYSDFESYSNGSSSSNSGMSDYYRRKYKEVLDEAAEYERMADMALASNNMSSYQTYRNMVLSAKKRAQNWLDMIK